MPIYLDQRAVGKVTCHSSTFIVSVYRCSQADGTAESSFVVDLLRESVEDELTIKWAAASMSAAGPDTVRGPL